jgi:hypothetical protein
MVGVVEFRFCSRAIAWCRYFPDSLDLDVCFVNGAAYRYAQVPQSAVEGLASAPSVGKYFNRNIAHHYLSTLKAGGESPPIDSSGTRQYLLKQSLEAVSHHLPQCWNEPIARLLTQTPILVRVVGRRRTKHGDHRLIPSRACSIITVNAAGNPWQFVVTLLHEIAHAQVAQKFANSVAPHGREWKHAFGTILCSHRDLFPPSLTDAVSDYARSPFSSTDKHLVLAKALRSFDAFDRRPTVGELGFGPAFSLDGSRVLIKQRLLRKRFLCQAEDGRRFRVSPSARVEVLYDEQ